MVVEDEGGFGRTWRAEVLAQAPMIAPVRQYTYPLHVPGEEDAMARGALQLLVRPGAGGSFLATCALGFTSASMPTGVLGCPRAEEMCAVAGGYAYVIDTGRPEISSFVPMKPVVEVRVLAEAGLLLFVGFHGMAAWGAEGLAWETARLSWEGIRLTEVEGGMVRGFGWEMRSDREMAFAVDLRTGVHTGGAYAGAGGPLGGGSGG